MKITAAVDGDGSQAGADALAMERFTRQVAVAELFDESVVRVAFP